MKHRTSAWATVHRHPHEPAKVWVTFYPDYGTVQDIMDEHKLSMKAATQWLWEHGNRVPTTHFATWDSENPHCFAYEWLTVAEADDYLNTF